MYPFREKVISSISQSEKLSPAILGMMCCRFRNMAMAIHFPFSAMTDSFINTPGTFYLVSMEVVGLILLRPALGY